MGFGRKGKVWETECKKLVIDDFNAVFVCKLINTEHIDFLAFDGNNWYLIEAKSTKKEWYYTKDTKRKREQWKEYFKQAQNLNAKVYLYLKKKGKIFKYYLPSYESIAVKY